MSHIVEGEFFLTVIPEKYPQTLVHIIIMSHNFNMLRNNNSKNPLKIKPWLIFRILNYKISNKSSKKSQ